MKPSFKEEKLINLDWEKIVENLSSLATSSEGAHRLLSCSPLENEAEALKSFETIRECLLVLQTGRRPQMRSLDLYQNWFLLINKNSKLSPLHLKDIRSFLIDVLALFETLTEFNTDQILLHKRDLINPEDALDKIETLLSPDGSIKTNASQTLYDLYGQKKDLSKSVQKTLDKLVKSYEIEDIIQDKYVTNREGRWVLPIKSGMQHRFEGIIHDSSQSRQTVFMEPTEVIKTNNKIRQIEVAIKDEIERLLLEISEYFFELKSEIQSAFDTLVFFDEFLAKAQLALKTSGNPCKFTSESINLIQLKNPYLILNSEDVVPNSIELNQESRILLLSGPNAGGKTVLLKSIGLAMQMARCGLYISASLESSLPFAKNILSSVGDHQSLFENLSSFASHLKILDQGTRFSGPNNIILVDEICSSTDPEEGSALARSFIKTYSKQKCFCIITSHFNYLKKGWSPEDSVLNGSMDFDLDRGPTYQFLSGLAGESLAIQTAKRIGIDKKIIDSALSYLSPESRAYANKIDDLGKVKSELNEKTKELSKLKSKYSTEIHKYKQLIEKYEQDKDLMLEKSIKRAEQKIDNMIQVNKAGKVLEKNNDLLKIKEKLPEVIKSKGSSDSSSFLPKNKEEFSEKYPPGSRVFIPSLKKEGLVQGKPNQKGFVEVVAQSMRLSLSWKDLKPLTQNFTNPSEQILKRKGFFKLSKIEGDLSIDLRGKSVEEAIGVIEVELDKATVSGDDRIKIIHGHGTNSLKRAVRSYLSRCIYVKNWAAGTKNSGGDGVTWVEIND